jgi:hypothetical protein
MEMIRRRAFQSAARDCGLAALAALALMFHWAGDPVMALKAGAIGFTVVAIFMVLRVDWTEHSNVEGNEVWINLRQDERPPQRVAKRLIEQAMRQACYSFAWLSSGVALSLWGATIGAGLTGL